MLKLTFWFCACYRRLNLLLSPKYQQSGTKWFHHTIDIQSKNQWTKQTQHTTQQYEKMWEEPLGFKPRQCHQDNFWSFWDFSFWGGSGLVGGPTLKHKTKSATSEQNSQHAKFEFQSISATHQRQNFLKNSKMWIRNCGEWGSHVKMPKNRVFCKDYRSPLYSAISTRRRGASHYS